MHFVHSEVGSELPAQVQGKPSEAKKGKGKGGTGGTGGKGGKGGKGKGRGGRGPAWAWQGQRALRQESARRSKVSVRRGTGQRIPDECLSFPCFGGSIRVLMKARREATGGGLPRRCFAGNGKGGAIHGSQDGPCTHCGVLACLVFGSALHCPTGLCGRTRQVWGPTTQCRAWSPWLVVRTGCPSGWATAPLTPEEGPLQP